LDQAIYRCADCQLDSANRRFTRLGREVILEPKVFAVLVQLLMRPGELLTREQLLDAVWGHRFVTASTLNRVIALARRAFGDDADVPRYIQTVYGAGYRFVGAIEKASATPEVARARFSPPPAARLPARLQRLIGREHELALMEDLLREGRALTVVGTGGMGKTQCAITFAHEHTGDYPDGIWFFDLAPMRQPGEWLQALALALRIAPSGESELLGKIAHSLADRRALLVLDNCDQLSAGVGALQVELLQRTEQPKFLATSQQQLNFVGERLMRLPPLRLPVYAHPATDVELNEVAHSPALSLLLARIRDVQPEFELSGANAPALIEICRRLDGMPLALELAAARFSLLSAEQVLDRLDQRFRFLVSDRSGRDQRHRNLLALLDWSYRLLSKEEQRFLAWLSVFVQGWTVDAVIDLAGAFGSTPETAVDLLTGLADKSLIAVDQSTSPPRYRLLETVREFALEELRIQGDERHARDAQLAYVLRMAKCAHRDLLEGRMRERIAMLIHEHGNIDSASAYSVGPANDRQAALRIPGLLMLYFKAHGAPAFAESLCERALAGAPSAHTRDLALALMCRGVNQVTGNKQISDSSLRDAVRIAQEMGDDWTAAYSSGYLALLQIHEGRPDRVAKQVAVIEQTSKRLNDEILAGLAGLVRGWKYLAEDANQKAIDELWPVRTLGGDFHQHHFIDIYLGLAYFRLGEDVAAARLWHESMRNAIAVGHARGVAGAVEGCAYLAHKTSKAEQACRFLSVADQIRTRMKMPLFRFWVGHNEMAQSGLLATLGADRYQAAKRSGVTNREEDVINEAAALLRELSGAAALPAQSYNSVPAGS
jgi:predicted ATPase/DNA-binding winged helix-turn-helix (wHTH) protein